MPNNFPFNNSRLQINEIFDGCSEEEMNILTRSGITQIYKKGELIFKERGTPIGIYWIQTGMVKKYKLTPKGGEQIIFVCGPGELLGYHALLSDEYYSDNSAAIHDATITFIPKADFLTVVQSSPTLSNKLIKALGHEFSVFVTSITSLASKTVRERLAYNLLLLEEKFKTSDETVVQIILSRTDLANIVGTATETVVRILYEFKEMQFIELDGKSITITNKAALLIEASQSDL